MSEDEQLMMQFLARLRITEATAHLLETETGGPWTCSSSSLLVLCHDRPDGPGRAFRYSQRCWFFSVLCHLA